MRENMSISKTVALTIHDLEIIDVYQKRIKKNFSETLRAIIDEWYNIFKEVEEYKLKKEFENIKNAKILKEGK